METAREPTPSSAAAERTFALPELLEHILLYLLDDLVEIVYGTDPRSALYEDAAHILSRLLRCSLVNTIWRHCILHSKRLQRSLYLVPLAKTTRSWERHVSDSEILHDPNPSRFFPTLNPVIVTTFRNYHFRFWRLSYGDSGIKPCAFLIIERRDMPDVESRAATHQGRTISGMLLSQPPCMAMEATIWDERDETKDYVGRTILLRDASIHQQDGLTIGYVHKRVAKMFDDHPDVTAIKLTTL
ncbi:hypothetical protein BAUCODRAFT_196841 [Baudoinia panamericana UAMH 10762]|uniref:Uncharacterized protein n=1 Tax=Baudoinia panamericana (strain UAMH 10762) TaxID=717646 RepID=M2NQ31_BAUPA|nr:uncharacterized protein BAUCODRAFT_196841 [Baudoinia panamericana UAMH 10762]EMD01121.1 hypothetical protein BAUCODRAFT_196841 [Baudoinia panamericana UAMH 10762]